MNENKNILTIKKQLLTESFYKARNNKKLFRDLDERVIKKCFFTLAEQSTNENILNIDTLNLTSQDVHDFFDRFIKQKNFKTLYYKRQIYEIVKLSNLPAQKLLKLLSKSNFLQLGKKLSCIVSESLNIGLDFLVLRIINNLLLKISSDDIKKLYFDIRNSIFKKLKIFPYTLEKKESISTYFCWIDLLLNATLEYVITPQDYINITKKIVYLTSKNIDLLWKISSSLSFLLQQNSFCDVHILRNHKRDVIKKINEEYLFQTFSKDDVIDIMTNTLSKKTVWKEDYYQLFDAIRLFAEKSDKNKLFCFTLLWYIFSQHKKNDIFSYRFVREYFLNTLFNIINNQDSTDVKIEEYLFLSMLISRDAFNNHKAELFERLLLLLKSFNNNNLSISSQLFYKFCDILDFVSTKLTVLNYKNIASILANDKRTEEKIIKHLELSF